MGPGAPIDKSRYEFSFKPEANFPLSGKRESFSFLSRLCGNENTGTNPRKESFLLSFILGLGRIEKKSEVSLLQAESKAILAPQKPMDEDKG